MTPPTKIANLKTELDTLNASDDPSLDKTMNLTYLIEMVKDVRERVKQ